MYLLRHNQGAYTQAPWVLIKHSSRTGTCFPKYFLLLQKKEEVKKYPDTSLIQILTQQNVLAAIFGVFSLAKSPSNCL